ncbi:MAG: 2-oxo acid dehydrogenase subunit E2 [Bacteroidales bacterium]|nr:2-oxo acid dehydrogenase subunit E2 [Bacteroidales bacterium]
MAKIIIMPRQGQSVESCIITKRFFAEGEKVGQGDLLFEYETDKASFEEESEVNGIMLKWLYDEGDEVPVLETVCIIGDEGEDIEELISGDVVDKEVSAPVIKKQEPRRESSGSDVVAEGDFRISPRARRLAEDKKIDIKKVKGTGPGGRVIVRDIEAVLIDGDNLHTEGSYSIEPLTNIRKIIAKTMYSSLQNSAQLTHHLGADARRILRLRQEIKAKKDQSGYVNVTINDMVCFAVIKALQKFPRVNSHLIGEEMHLFRSVSLGFAVDTDRGLMVPSITESDKLSIQQFSEKAGRISEECRKGSVDPDILIPESASFTVSNLGNYGVEMFTPVINLPQVAILGVNTILPRPADTGDGVIGFVPYIGLSLTYDHRALDGGEATRFLKQVAIEIETLKI